MLVRSHAFHDGKRAHERMVAAVQTSWGPLQRRAEDASVPCARTSPSSSSSLVEIDDEAAQCVVDGHFNYKQREWLDSQSQ